MGGFKVLRGAAVAVVALVVVFSMTAAAAWAEAPTTICVPEYASSQVLSTNAKGECPAKVISKTTVKYKSEALPGTTELEKLDKLLPHVSYVQSGVAGKPTIQLTGVNLQVVNGEGKTAGVNGTGNVVIGYDETPGEQIGSHNLILGEGQTFTSYGGIVAGFENHITAPHASIVGGEANTASAINASVSGGAFNKASGEDASVSGGVNNKAQGRESSASGGSGNTSSGPESSVTGGYQNLASYEDATVSGGYQNAATGPETWVGGGYKNNAKGRFSSIFGGNQLFAPNSFEAIP
jgi:hypothetical protein